jgi:hypothetical protein
MLSAFLNPLTIIAGSALVLTPIIIHLINRIRFRRVKWAAMEFLLKAQKRMRRRKILEQLILLLLRCLLVFLVGMLFARFIGCGDDGKGGKETRPTTHVVILDDTPSMAEVGRDAQHSAFEEAKRLVYEKLMPAAAEATTTQTLHVIRLSDLENPFPADKKTADGKESQKTPDEIREEAKVQAKSIAAMEDYLRPLQPATVHRSLVDGLSKAKALLDQRAAGNSAQIIHILSDLRSVDWNADGPAITEKLKEFKDNGVQVHLIDVSSPARKADRKSPSFNDNVAILEFKPRNRVVSVNQQTELEIRVKNFGSADLKDVKIDFYLNGRADLPFQTIQIPTLPPNQERTQTVQGTLTQASSKDKPLERFNIITAVLSAVGGDGLAIDNSRHTVVEVRDTLKVLVVDGRVLENGVDMRQKPEGDSYYLRTLFQTKAQELGNIEVVSAEAKELDKLDLRPYSSVYLMNVPELSTAAVANIEKYVKAGGGVGVFLGKDVKPTEYNERCYRTTHGFFPMPLPSEPSKELTPDQKLTRELAFAKRVILREAKNKEHPALKRIYTNDRGEIVKDDGVERFFYFANIDVHWPVSRRGGWREDKKTEELYCLPNDEPISSFEEGTEKLTAEVQKRWGEPKFEQARKYLPDLLEKIRKTPKEAAPLSVLARYLDQLLCDQISDGHESEPVLREFWNQPEMAETKQLAMELRDNKKQWTDWPSLKGSPSWVVIVGEMQKYLSGGADEANRPVGEKFFAEFDFNRYEPTVTVNFITADATKPGTERSLPLFRKDLGKLTMDAPPHPAGTPADAPPPPFRLTYPDTKTPGVYMFTLVRKPEEKGLAPPGGPAVTPDPLGGYDFVAAAFNVDAANEGDLRRENTDELAKHTNKAPLHNTEDLGWIDDLKQKPTDLSSGRWIYLLILLVLLAEQAWAVRISYHTKPEDLEMLAPSAAAAYAHSTTPSPASAGAPGEPAEGGAPLNTG